MITSTTITVCNYRLRVLEAGKGTPVLLLHGFAVSADDWRPTLELLAESGYRGIAVDSLGFGESDKPAGSVYSLRLYADLNAGVLDALGIERAAIVGHSMGAKLAIATAIYHPGRVTRLMLVDSEGFTQIPLFMRKGGSLPGLGEAILKFSAKPAIIKAQLMSAFHDPTPYVTEELIERGRTVLADPGIRGAMLALSRNYEANDLQGSGLRARLGELKCPTLIVWGAEDRWFAPSCGEVARREIPGSQLVIIPRCGHLPQMEAFRTFHGLLLGFVSAA